jgi:membrane-bound lytic murein transglycosylase B
VSVAAALLLACAQEATDPPDPTPEATGVPEAPGAPEGEGTDGQADPPPDPPSEAADEPAAPPHPEPPAEIDGFDDAEELASTLAAAEQALADPDTPEEHRDRWAWAHQQAYRDLAANPTWAEVARTAIPHDLEPAFELTLRAVAELSAMTRPQPAPPDRWRIVAPTPLDELRSAYARAEETTGAPAEVLAAINLVETRFGRIQGDSTAGAQGPMQFMPPTWDHWGEGDVHDAHDAIAAAGRYLADHGAPDDLRSAVYAYNHSERYVDAVLAHAETIARFDHYLDVLHRWRVYYRTVDGDLILEEGYGS